MSANRIRLIVFQCIHAGDHRYVLTNANRAPREVQNPNLRPSLRPFPRTLEMLDQYDLFFPLAQVGFVARNAVNYDRDGKRDNTRGPMRHVFDSVQGNTFHDYMLNIRLKYSEEIIQKEYEMLGGIVIADYELRKMSINEEHKNSKASGEYPVSIEIGSVSSPETRLLAG